LSSFSEEDDPSFDALAFDRERQVIKNRAQRELLVSGIKTNRVLNAYIFRIDLDFGGHAGLEHC